MSSPIFARPGRARACSTEGRECQAEYLFTPRIFRAYIRTREGVKPFFSRIFIHLGKTRGLYRHFPQSQAFFFAQRKERRAHITKGGEHKGKHSAETTYAEGSKIYLTRRGVSCYTFPNGLRRRAIRAGSAPSLGDCLSLPPHSTRSEPRCLYVVTRRSNVNKYARKNRVLFFPFRASCALHFPAVCHSVFPFVFAKCSACACQSGKLNVRFTEGSPGAFIGVSGDGGESVSGVVWPTE